MNTTENALNITEEMVNNNTSIDFMICDGCKLMAREEGSSHEAKELFLSLPPKVFIISVKRFDYDKVLNPILHGGNNVPPGRLSLGNRRWMP